MNPATAIGTRIGPYEIVGWLGAGGMGEVFRARDSRLGRDVAIKLVDAALASDAGRVRRFEQEARAAGQLNHPNILIVYDTGVHDAVPYLVSELLEGQTLRSRLAGAAMSPRRAIDAARQVAEGLAAAHDKGIVHRDVKPDNLFVTIDGRIKILDFGIAKLTTAPDIGSPTGLPTDTAAGTVVGTARYMSPEQIRGEPVDARSDIFSLGIVLHEMLTGRPAFARDTAPETMAAILKEEPAHPLPADVPPALARIVARCLEKSRETRFQSARDLAFGLDVLSGTHSTAPAAGVRAARRWPAALGVTLAVLILAGVVASWLNRTPRASFERLLTNATFTPFTNFEGSEQDAAISPDGKFVVFLSDRDGPFHAFLKQVSTGSLLDLTPGTLDYKNPGPVRSVGFVADGSETWLSGTSAAGRRLSVVPLMGGAPRAILQPSALNVSWSPDGTQLAFGTFDPGDALFVADRNGGNARQIFIGTDGRGDHNHFPAWSTDGTWIYFTRSRQSLAEFDVFRIRPSGGEPERLTELQLDIRYLTPIDARTVLFVAPDQDRSGPWLWALDVEQKVARRISTGLDRYLSVSASADGRRLVAAVAKSTAGLWSVPILDQIAEERDVSAYPVPTVRGLAPRFGGAALFYLSSGGAGDGLWRLQDGKPTEIWKGSDGALFEPAAVSPRDGQVLVVLSREGKRRLTLMSADGANRRSLAATIDVRGTPSWSPNAEWIVTGGTDAQGPGLFKIAVDSGTAVRLAAGPASDPVVSPDGTTIVYAGQQTASAPLLAVRPDSSPVKLPPIRVLSGGAGRARFLASGNLVYMRSHLGMLEFWLLDMSTNTPRQIARLSNPAATITFDVTPDGRHIVFDRVREHSDLVLIDLVK